MGLTDLLIRDSGYMNLGRGVGVGVGVGGGRVGGRVGCLGFRA